MVLLIRLGFKISLSPSPNRINSSPYLKMSERTDIIPNALANKTVLAVFRLETFMIFT
jgi:hypothetical protein